MVALKEHKKESALRKRMAELEELLLITKKQLKREWEYSKELEAVLKEVGESRRSTTITIKSATKIDFVQINDIVCCNADEAYTDVKLINGSTITASKPLITFENLLQGHPFFRISKSHIINTNHILTFFKNRNQVLLKGDIVLDVARRRKVAFLKTL